MGQAGEEQALQPNLHQKQDPIKLQLQNAEKEQLISLDTPPLLDEDEFANLDSYSPSLEQLVQQNQLPHPLQPNQPTTEPFSPIEVENGEDEPSFSLASSVVSLC